MIDVDTFLEHHGVKEQRWGVRNDPKSSNQQTRIKEEPFHLTKKQVGIGAGILVGVAITAALLANKGKIETSILTKGFEESPLSRGKDEAVKLLAMHGDSQDITFPKGKVFSRVSNIAETQIRQGAYVVHEPIDVARYKSFWQSEENRHNISIQAISDVKVPSLKNRLNTLTEMIDKPLPGEKKTLRQWLMSNQPTLRSKLWVRSAPANELAKYHYVNMTGNNWGKGLGKAFSDRLIAKGYGAMQDDRDGSNNLAFRPLVLLNRGLFKILGNNKMTKSETNSAYQDFKDLMKTGKFVQDWPMPEGGL